MALDPDEQAQDVVRLIFDKFDELGTVSSLLRYLVRNRILLPVRPHFGPDRGQLEWRRPNRMTLTFLLHHPIYAGAYSHGRRPTDPRRKIPGRPATGRRLVPMEQWEVLIRDRLPGYISWERYEANLQRLARNRARVAAMGPTPRRGLAPGRADLLRALRASDAGLLSRRVEAPRYSCQRGAIEYAEPACQSLAGQGLDELIARLVLTVLEPAGVGAQPGGRRGPAAGTRAARPPLAATAGAGSLRGRPGGAAVSRRRAREPIGGAGTGTTLGTGPGGGARRRGGIRPLPARPAGRADGRRS